MDSGTVLQDRYSGDGTFSTTEELSNFHVYNGITWRIVNDSINIAVLCEKQRDR